MQTDQTAIAMLLNVPPGRQRLLVVDDQPINIQVMYQIFASQYQVFMATSGQQALDFCHRTPPDLVLLDVVMPGMDGFEVCQALKAAPDTHDIPVIFVTAHTAVSYTHLDVYKRQPLTETHMSDSQIGNFGKFVPGFDFLQNLAKSASQTIPQMPNMSNWIAPTMSVEDLEKRINELKAVHFWLDQNTRALGATVQALSLIHI